MFSILSRRITLTLRVTRCCATVESLGYDLKYGRCRAFDDSPYHPLGALVLRGLDLDNDNHQFGEIEEQLPVIDYSALRDKTAIVKPYF